MHTLSRDQADRLSRAALSSVACEASTGVPAELTISQWALESGWGAHQPGNNCFGIKAYSGCFGVQQLATVEVISGVGKPCSAEFATFPTLEACFEKHAVLLTSANVYRPAWTQYRKSKNVAELIRQIAPIYATDPNYAATLLEIAGRYDVASCLAVSRKAAA